MSTRTLMLGAALAWAGAAQACDPSHSWQEEAAFSRKDVSERAIRSMVLSWLSKLAAQGKPVPSGATIALASVSDGYACLGVVAAGRPAPVPLDGAQRRSREEHVARAFGNALEQAGITVIPVAKTSALLDGGEATPAACARIAREAGASLIVSLRLLDYAQMTRVDADTVPANKGLLCQYLFETVRARIDTKAANGTSIDVDEVRGLVRDGWLFMTDGAPAPKVKYFIEYHVERPGQDALAYQLKPGHGHLGLRP